jgi:hypothetical protein
MYPARKTRTLTFSGASARGGEPWRWVVRRWTRWRQSLVTAMVDFSRRKTTRASKLDGGGREVRWNILSERWIQCAEKYIWQSNLIDLTYSIVTPYPGFK